MDTSPGFSSPVEDSQRLRPLSESPYDNGDDWGESLPQRPIASTHGSPPSRSQWAHGPDVWTGHIGGVMAKSPMDMTASSGSPWRSRSKLGSCRSAPLLAAAASTQATTWYASSPNRSLSSQGPTMWSSLGGTWRERSQDDFGLPVRRNVDESNAFSSGCVPNWSRVNIRKTRALEHELTWSYYRMRRHELHPERKSVGDPHMPPECVVQKMRSGTKNQFNFWRDLRPPFHVSHIKRDIDEPNVGHHPDGDLFHVTYQCAIDYVGERLWNEKSVGGTFDNLIHGVATVRVSDGYPQGKGLVLVSWGRPSLIWSKDEEFDENGAPIQDFIDPDKWMPISQELGLRADMTRFAACRESTRKCNNRRPLEVAPLQSILLGPHASLPRLAATADKSSPLKAASPTKKVDGGVEGATPSPIKKKRQHRIFTAAAGFVRYAG